MRSEDFIDISVQSWAIISLHCDCDCTVLEGRGRTVCVWGGGGGDIGARRGERGQEYALTPPLGHQQK